MTAAVSDEVRERVGELGRRYVHLVYGAAVRQVGEGRGAEDVTQAVFPVALQKARNGGLPEEGRMAGWLLKVTGFAASRARRAERGRRRIEERAAQDEATGATAGIHLDIQELRAALDGALLRLGATDREVVVRRYLRGEAVAEVAAAVGLSENTAGRRITRALEKLRKILQRRGVLAPVAGLASVMLAEGAKAAPAGLGASAAVVSGSASAAAVSIAKGATVMMKVAMVKVAAAVCMLLVVGVGAGLLVWRTVHAAEVPGVLNVGGQAPLGPVASKPAAITAEDIKQALGSDIYRWSTNLRPGDWYQVSLDVQLAAGDPVGDLFPGQPQQVSENQEGATDLTISFLKLDHSLAYVLLSDEKQCEVRVTPSGGGGWSQVIPVPLGGADVKHKMTVQSPKIELFSEAGATTLLVIFGTDPSTNKAVAYPRAMLTLRHIEPPAR